MKLCNIFGIKLGGKQAAKRQFHALLISITGLVTKNRSLFHFGFEWIMNINIRLWVSSATANCSWRRLFLFLKWELGLHPKLEVYKFSLALWGNYNLMWRGGGEKKGWAVIVSIFKGGWNVCETCLCSICLSHILTVMLTYQDSESDLPLGKHLCTSLHEVTAHLTHLKGILKT